MMVSHVPRREEFSNKCCVVCNFLLAVVIPPLSSFLDGLPSVPDTTSSRVPAIDCRIKSAVWCLGFMTTRSKKYMMAEIAFIV